MDLYQGAVYQLMLQKCCARGSFGVVAQLHIIHRGPATQTGGLASAMDKSDIDTSHNIVKCAPHEQLA
eukprot:6480970-Amphidinium_carterae.1